MLSILEKEILLDIKGKKLDLNKLPKHIALIMDGNRRWAKNNNLNSNFGHIEGAKSLKEIIKTTLILKIPIITIYAFSTENNNRSSLEVTFLMNIFEKYIYEEGKHLHNNNIRVNFIGNKINLPLKIQKAQNWLENITKNNTSLIFNIALNYSGRVEIIDSIKNIINDINLKKLKVSELNENSFNKYLYTSNLPDPDLLIRTSGEKRISNYLLWQLAYTEFYFTNTFWPDFTSSELIKALKSYQNRERRFGKI